LCPYGTLGQVRQETAPEPIRAAYTGAYTGRYTVAQALRALLPAAALLLLMRSLAELRSEAAWRPDPNYGTVARVSRLHRSPPDEEPLRPVEPAYVETELGIRAAPALARYGSRPTHNAGPR
jgi:hypothetical protein